MTTCRRVFPVAYILALIFDFRFLSISIVSRGFVFIFLSPEYSISQFIILSRDIFIIFNLLLTERETQISPYKNKLYEIIAKYSMTKEV